MTERDRRVTSHHLWWAHTRAAGITGGCQGAGTTGHHHTLLPESGALCASLVSGLFPCLGMF